MLSHVYGAIAERRRRWYARHPEVRRRLEHPVVSVGALSAGGSGKTPVVAHLAARLVAMGERPAVLSRGYRRERRLDGALVVRDASAVRADLGMAGDEPFMLARRLEGASVLVSEDRYLAGRLAEKRLGASVHLLDDGFQHLAVERDVNLLVLGEHDLDDPRTLPGGRLRERPAAARAADALIVETPSEKEGVQLAGQFGVADGFHFTKRLGPPRDAESETVVEIPTGARVLAVAGIARPDSFVEGLAAIGLDVADALRFADHHPFSSRDLATIRHRVESLSVEWVLTTEKDLVRLLPLRPFDLPMAWVPLTVVVEPAARFRDWLGDRLSRARADRAARPGH